MLNSYKNYDELQESRTLSTAVRKLEFNNIRRTDTGLEQNYEEYIPEPQVNEIFGIEEKKNDDMISSLKKILDGKFNILYTCLIIKI